MNIYGNLYRVIMLHTYIRKCMLSLKCYAFLFPSILCCLGGLCIVPN